MAINIPGPDPIRPWALEGQQALWGGIQSGVNTLVRAQEARKMKQQELAARLGETLLDYAAKNPDATQALEIGTRLMEGDLTAFKDVRKLTDAAKSRMGTGGADITAGTPPPDPLSSTASANADVRGRGAAPLGSQGSVFSMGTSEGPKATFDRGQASGMVQAAMQGGQAGVPPQPAQARAALAGAGQFGPPPPQAPPGPPPGAMAGAPPPGPPAALPTESLTQGGPNAGGSSPMAAVQLPAPTPGAPAPGAAPGAAGPAPQPGNPPGFDMAAQPGPGAGPMAAPGAPGMEQGPGMAGAAPPPGSYDEYKEQIKTVAQTSLSELLQMIPQKAAELFEAHKENIYLSEPPPSTFDQVFGASDPESRKRRVRAKFINKITDQLTQELIGKNIEQASARLRAAQEAEATGLPFGMFLQELQKQATPQTRADEEKDIDNQRQADRDAATERHRARQLANQARRAERVEGRAGREELKTKKQEVKDEIADLDKQITHLQSVLETAGSEREKGDVAALKASDQKVGAQIRGSAAHGYQRRLLDAGISGPGGGRAKLDELRKKREELKAKLEKLKTGGGEEQPAAPAKQASGGRRVVGVEL